MIWFFDGVALFAALAIVAPRDGSVVPTLKEAQKAYLSGARAERFARMDNAADRARLLRTGATQRPLRLEWTGETNAVYLLNIVRDGSEEESFAVSNRTEVWVTNLELGRRYQWMVRQAGTLDSATASFVTEGTAPRLLRADGVGNFRDLGGWKTSDGRRVKENLVFRSAGLRFSSKSSGGFFRRKVELGARRVTDAGIETLRDDFKVKTDLELRTPQETAGMDDTVLGAGVRWENVSFAAYGFVENLVRGREPFAHIFRIFTKHENYPVLFHCSGGRDRTGTLAFLLNGLLGVSEDDLCRDWEASVFSDNGMKFTSDRIKGLISYLNTLPGATMKERCESYAKSCGITSEEIAAFRAIMLE